jgi:TusA-related sulfurtransferase
MVKTMDIAEYGSTSAVNPDSGSEPTSPQRFLELLAARDFERLQATLADDARARLLLPYGLEEPVGKDAIVSHFKRWFGSASSFELVSSSEEVVGSRQRITWRFKVVREGGRPEVIEQLVYLNCGPEGVRQIDLLCSGFQQSQPLAADVRKLFDAGSMGCADGLAQEFRQQMADVPVGGLLEVVVRDPAAREDLPALARMLGQHVKSTEATADGRLIITVERRK